MFKTTAHYKGRKIVETFATWQEAQDRANWHWSKGADVAEWGQVRGPGVSPVQRRLCQNGTL